MSSILIWGSIYRMQGPLSAYTGSIFSEAPSNCAQLCDWLLDVLGPRKVIEIGTSYGPQLKFFAPKSTITVCVDPMYNWVPDVKDDADADPNLIDQNKVFTWKENTKDFADKVELVIANSYFVHQKPEYEERFKDTDILIVDGCHHPSDLVLKDYTNFRRFLKDEHFVIFDDVHEGDVAKARDDAVKEMVGLGYQTEQITWYNATLIWFKK